MVSEEIAVELGEYDYETHQLRLSQITPNELKAAGLKDLTEFGRSFHEYRIKELLALEHFSEHSEGE